MSQDNEIKCQHFASLKAKYEASDYEDFSPLSPLYLILRKADLGLEIQYLEYLWLQRKQLVKTANLIKDKQQDESKRILSLSVEFTKLKSKYQVDNYHYAWNATPLYFILLKINSGDILTQKESN